MTPFELIAYLQDNLVTPALIPILKANYIDADGTDEIELQDLESFVFYQRNQLPNGRKKTIKKRTTKEIISEQISYNHIDNEDTSLIYRHSGEGLDNRYNYNDYSSRWTQNPNPPTLNSVRAWIDEDEYSDTYGKLFLTIQFQSIELAGQAFDEQGGISLFSPSPISLEDYYYDIDNSMLEFNSWAQWDSYYSTNYIRLEYAGFSIPSLNNPPR
tara:strand:+ start:6794 stop:7435 length:642 start_codon:yes stop_codon:yes gene_type:complete